MAVAKFTNQPTNKQVVTKINDVIDDMGTVKSVNSTSPDSNGNVSITIPTVPTNVSAFTNDSGYITSSALSGYATETWVTNKGYAVASSLATVATSGSYNDLTNKPTIPTVNNATLTIQKNGTTVKTFTANASSNVTANITVPTKVSELTNDSGYTTNTGTVTSVNNVSPVNGNVSLTIPAAQIQSDWNQTNTSALDYIKNKPTIPSEVVVDQTYDGTSANAQSGVAIAGAGFLTSHQDISGKANTSMNNLSAAGKLVLDGQWVSLNQAIIENQSLNNSSGTALTKTVNVPNDGQTYDVLFSGIIETTASSGNAMILQIKTNKLTARFTCVAGTITRSSSTMGSRGAVIMPISRANDNLTIDRQSGYKGYANLYAIAYRRVGTNT